MRTVILGKHRVELPKGALYFAKDAEEPSIDMVIHLGRIIVSSDHVPFLVWLGPVNFIPCGTFGMAVDWCAANPVLAKVA